MPTTKIDVTPKGLALLRLMWWPEGSGPIGAMRCIVTLINLLAEEKGIDLDSVVVEHNGHKYSGSPPRRVKP